MAAEDMRVKFPIFKDRFFQLRGEFHMTQAEFAGFLSMSRPTIGFYEKGERLPDALGIRTIAEKCGVRSDWLLGLTDYRNYDNELVGQQAKLCEDAIENLKRLDSHQLQMANLLISNNYFDQLLSNLNAYVSNAMNNEELMQKISAPSDDESFELANAIARVWAENPGKNVNLIENISINNLKDTVRLLAKDVKDQYMYQIGQNESVTNAPHTKESK